MFRSSCSKKGFFTLLALLLVMFIIAVIYHVIVKVYLNRPAVEQSPSYQSTLDNTRETIQNLNKRSLQREEEMSR